MDIHEFAERIFLNLPYDPTDQQIELIAALSKFCSADMPDGSVFLLCGYAGTGKTSLTGALVRALREASIPVVLMAPTGRAAKVLSAMSGMMATTIHRRIYRSSSMSGLSYMSGEVADNPMQNAVFIVDEASMIGADGSDFKGNLLEDLIHYVYTGQGCRMILLGDTAQLPPVGCTESPAMNVGELRSYGLRVMKAVLTRIVRQGHDSGILYNATRLRRNIKRGVDKDGLLPIPSLVIKGFPDVECVDAADLEDAIASSYSSFGEEATIMITRSNRRATAYNLAIRSRILGRDEELCKGERLMVARNNYLWSAKVKGLDFIANGDMATVERVYGVDEKYGLRFADVSISLPDRGGVTLDCKVMLDTLTSDYATLPSDELGEFYQAAVMDADMFTADTPYAARMKILRADPYVAALQVKYAYTVTCHKAQGGQWSHVFIDMGAIADEATRTVDFYRWLYTAVTRATEKITFVSPQLKIIE
ncbi:MAG: AAA family ATPase [Muribaculaceae bacterium]|nr:AAA family ATPase [Muribaculaceae bacterium]